MTPTRKGFNPVKLPFAIKSSDRTFAAWANEVVTALQQLRDRVPQSNTARPATASGSRPPFWTTLSQVPESDPAEYQVSVTLGYLTYQNAGAVESEQGATGYIVPKINGVALDDEAVEPLELPAVVSYVYLRVKTDADGVPKLDGESVTIEAFDAPQESVHHVRPSPLSGEEEGDYFFLICETEEIPDSSPAAPRIKRRLTGNREMPNQLVEIANVSEGDSDSENVYEVYKGYEVGPDDKHLFRAIEQVPVPEGVVGSRLIAPKEEGDDPGDSIKLKIIQKGNDSTVPWTIEEEDEAAVVRMQGNDDPYIDPFGGQVNFSKGLCTGVQGGAVTGWWGSVQWVHYPAGGGSPIDMTLTFRNGILIEVLANGAVVPGTENTPGNNGFVTADS